MMKIKVLMIDIGGWGGITHYTYNLMQALAAQAEIECVLLTDQAYELDGLPRDFRVMKRAFHGQPYISVFICVCKAVFAYKPRIIHVQTMLTARKDWFLFLLARLAGARIIFTAHNVLPHEDTEKQAFFMKTAFRFIYFSSRKIIAHSNFTRGEIMRVFGVAGEKISVIPHGNYAFFRTREILRDEARRQLNILPDKKVVLHFGALRHYKGIESLLQAMNLLCKRHSDVMLLLAGKPMNVPERYFRRAIAQHGLDTSVMFIEKYIPAAEIPTIYFASDIVVLPYTHIDTSGSIQLAYGFSKPVVATKTGSMPEVVDHGVNGLLVEPGDPQALADAMERILFDEDERDRMGTASLVLAKEKFSWRSIAQKTCQAYREVAA